MDINDLKNKAARIIEKNPEIIKALQSDLYQDWTSFRNIVTDDNKTSVDMYLYFIDEIAKSKSRLVEKASNLFMLAGLKKARLFDIQFDVVASIMETCVSVSSAITDKPSLEMWSLTNPVDFEKLPFECTLFMFEKQPLQLVLNNYPGGQKVGTVMFVYAILLTNTKDIMYLGSADIDGHLVLETFRANNMPLTAVVAAKLLAFVNEHRLDVEEKEPPATWKKPKKGKKLNYKYPLPKPYYKLVVKQQIIEPKISEATGKTYEYQHRFDRRGHERCLIRRGSLPLDSKTKTLFIKRGYRVYTLDNPSPEDVQRIHERGGMDKGTAEWIAIKHLWIDEDCIPHNPDLPYIPAKRNVGIV